MAQTLLSVLLRLGTAEKINAFDFFPRVSDVGVRGGGHYKFAALGHSFDLDRIAEPPVNPRSIWGDINDGAELRKFDASRPVVDMGDINEERKGHKTGIVGRSFDMDRYRRDDP